jgi:hypothetical protein
MTAGVLRHLGMLLLAAATACADGDAGAAAAARGAAAATSGDRDVAGPPAPFEPASAPDDPCQWLTAKEAEGVLGTFGAPPARVRPGQRPRPDPRGTGCLYTLAEQPKIGRGTVTLTVSLHGATLADLATSMTEGMFGPRPAAVADSAAARSASRGWDHESSAGLSYLARVGHLCVQVDRGSIQVPVEKGERLAAAMRDKVPDRPFANPPDHDLLALQKAMGNEPEPPPQTPDPCGLLTRAEAEAVLGPLAVPPYRSAGDSPLWDAYGDGCSYYTGVHRVLTIKRTLSDGQSLFSLATGTSGVAATATGADEGMAADTLEGPWDDVMQDMYGTLRFLKGDRMLEVVWVTSGVERGGALQLAAKASGRL